MFLRDVSTYWIHDRRGRARRDDLSVEDCEAGGYLLELELFLNHIALSTSKSAVIGANNPTTDSLCVLFLLGLWWRHRRSSASLAWPWL